MEDAWEQRRTSFGRLADDYDATRPEWPVGTAAWLTGTEAGGRVETGGVLDVLDLGAGTGKLTRTLVAAGHRVTAVDPSEGMIAVLAASLPGVATRVAVAEDLGLPDRRFDVVTVAQAWHWVEPEEAAAECARVLRPGGLLSAAWHLRDTTVAWVQALDAVAGRPSYAAGASLEAQMAAEGFGEAFAPVQASTFGYQLELSPARLARLAGSWSYVAVRPDRADVLAEVEALGRRVAGRSGLLRLPFVTHCFRSTLLDRPVPD